MGPLWQMSQRHSFIKEAKMKHYVLLVGRGFIIPFDGFEGGKYVLFGVL